MKGLLATKVDVGVLQSRIDPIVTEVAKAIELASFIEAGQDDSVTLCNILLEWRPLFAEAQEMKTKIAVLEALVAQQQSIASHVTEDPELKEKG